MAQTWTVPNTGTDDFPTALKTEIPNALEALRTVHSGSSAPSSTVAYMLWADTSNGLLKQRNSGDTAWDTIGKLNTDLGKQTVALDLGDVSATSDHFLLVAPHAGDVVKVELVSSGSTTSDGSNKWTINVRNLTAANDLKAADYDTNTDGDFAADTKLDLGLDQNLTVAAGDVLEIQFALTGAPGTLTRCLAVLHFTSTT